MTTNSLQTLLVGFQGAISGTFRVGGPYYDIYKNGQDYVRLRLEDFSGHIYAFSWQQDVMRSPGMHDLSRVYVEGQIRQRGDQKVVELDTLIPARISYSDIVRLIPQQICPLPNLLPELASVLRLISHPALCQFIWQVLVDDTIAFPFVACPGSLNHHHNYPGGLLQHSLENVSVVESQSRFSQEDCQLGLVAALFHDIGKILTLTPQMTLTSLGETVEHGKLTMELLGPASHQLHKDWPEGAKKLRYLLGWKTNRSIPHYNVADLVACGDRISAGLDLDKRRNKA